MNLKTSFGRWWMTNIGRRGSTLLLFGFMAAHSGYEYIIYYPTDQLAANLYFYTSSVPLELWGSLFLIGGLIAIVGSYFKRLDMISFSVLSGLFGNWALAFLITYLADLFSTEQTSFDALGAAIKYGGVAALIAMCAGWAETRKEHR